MAHDLSVSAANKLLREKFGHPAFRPGQAEVLGHLLARRSAVAVFPTGGGKSVCYQLPALMLPGLTLVVSPLIALMKDQIDALTRRGIAAARLDSTLSAEESAQAMTDVRSGKARLLYVAPERFNNERFRESVRGLNIALFAVDEAHCISEWGHSFRPDYLKLAKFARQCRAERVLALTATATPQVLEDICQGFSIDRECAIRTSFYRPNLKVLTTPTDSAKRDALLVQRLKSRPAGPAIVYVTLQRTAEEVARQLAAAGLQAKAYHAGMEDEDRTAVQEWFLASDQGVVVATIAFGMGIDKPNIRYVYHYNLPKSVENYSQEIGRAGRDDLPSTCEMLLCPDDLNSLENFAYGDTPGAASVRDLVARVLGAGQDFDLSYFELSMDHDIRQVVVQTLLTYLELEGFLEARSPFYANYQFRPLASSEKILSRFEGERRQFLDRLLRQATRRQTWFDLDLERAAKAVGDTRDRVVRALDYLGEQKLLEVKVQGLRHRFRRLKPAADVESLANDLHARMQERERREIVRLQQVLELAARDGCQVAGLSAHFGETLVRPCGQCTWCTNGHRAVKLLPREKQAIDARAWRDALDARKRKPDPLSDPRALARFMCGISSPRLGKARLGSDPAFGALAAVPFPAVLERTTCLA